MQTATSQLIKVKYASNLKAFVEEKAEVCEDNPQLLPTVRVLELALQMTTQLILSPQHNELCLICMPVPMPERWIKVGQLVHTSDERQLVHTLRTARCATAITELA